MRINLRLILILFLFEILLLFFVRNTFAQQELEIPYPTLPGASPPTTVNFPLTSYLRYIYIFGIVIAGFLTFVLLVWGGILYLFSHGKPETLLEARKQITYALMGLLIVLSSYLILRTINPQLVVFPRLEIPPFSPTLPPTPPENLTFRAEFQEYPLGTLITSEYSASLYLLTTSTIPALRLPTSTDPIYTLEDYPRFFDLRMDLYRFYPTDFQGGLHGRRLLRINEAVSTTLSAFELLRTLSDEMAQTSEEFKKYAEELYKKSLECDCSFCSKPICHGNSTCGCGSCNTCFEPGGDVCPERSRMEELRNRILPSYYKNDDDPLNCLVYMMKYLAEHLRRFLDEEDLRLHRPLVRNASSTDYENLSYWFSDEARDLRNKIQACISASSGWESWISAPPRGNQLNNLFERIETVIWRSPTSSLAAVENKGTWSPKTDPPQRDIETNIKHLKSIYEALLDIKTRLNPYSNLFGSIDYLPWHGLIRFQTEAQMPESKIPISSSAITVTYPYVISGIGEVKTSEDPINFYASTMKQLYPTEPQTRSFFKNIAYAQEEELVTTKTSCARVVEIPVGTATDNALLLMNDILRELQNIYEKGHRVIDNITKQQELATSTAQELVEKLIDLTDRGSCECGTNCAPGCDCICIPFPPPIGVHCACFCKCMGNACPIDDITATYTQVQANNKIIKSAFEEIKELIGSPDDVVEEDEITNKEKTSIYESYFKINGFYPPWHNHAYESVPIGTRYCCSDARGNCRSPATTTSPGKGDLRMNMINKRNYSIKEKLAEVQKLLNRARELIRNVPNVNEDPQLGMSAYRILLEELIRLGLAEPEELTNITSYEKLDLSNCTLLVAEVSALTELKEEEKLLLNSKTARGEVSEYLPKVVDPFNPEVCSPDPFLDCDYFNPASDRRRQPLSCYIYDEDIDQKNYPQHFNLPQYIRYNYIETTHESEKIITRNLANNLFCCVVSQEGIKHEQK